LAIGVRERDAIVASGLEARPQRRPVSAIGRVANDPNARNEGDLVGRTVRAAVVDDDDLPRLESTREGPHCFHDCGRHHGRFVERGNDETQTVAIHAVASVRMAESTSNNEIA